MRLWSVAPDALDRAALIACWREALLAQAVLRGLTRGYTRHPQLERFRALSDPVAGVGAFLDGLAQEAGARGYRFDRTRIAVPPMPPTGEALPQSGLPGTGSVAIGSLPSTGLLPVTTGQLAFEWQHLRAKVTARAPEWLPHLEGPPRHHPLFTVVDGPVEHWERP